MCFTFKKNNKRTKNPVNRFLHDDASASRRSPQTSVVKSVQSTLSHLQSPPEWMQSQRNYGSFLSKSDLHGTISHTMIGQNCPKGKRQWLNQSNLLFPVGQHRTGGSNCETFEITWQAITLKAVLH